MKKNQTRRALLMSALSLLLCVSMLVGTTFAWFTDSVTSANNIIKSGNLDVEMYWADGTQAVPTDKTGWTDASQGAIFNYNLWEPGYTQVRHIKIANEGTLALKYKVSIVANGVVSDLANVIDVYYADPAVQVANRTDLTDANKLGTLTNVLEDLGETGIGELIAGASDTITIAFKMRETAGNEYMNKAIGTDFSVVLTATQMTYENDSFGPDYDDAAWVAANADALVKDANELSEALKNGGLIALSNTINGNVTIEDVADDTILNFAGNTINGTVTVAEGEKIVINGQGGVAATGTASALKVNKGADITLSGGTFTSENAAIAVANRTETPAAITIEEGTVITAPTIINLEQTSNYAGAEIVINGGEFNSTYTKSDARPIKVHGGDVTINGGTFTIDNPTGKNCYFIDVSSAYNTANDGTNKYITGNVEINGGTFKSNVPYTRAVFASMSSTHIPGTVVINGGYYEFTAENSYLVDVSANVIVNDCTYVGVKTANVFNISSTNPADLTITVNGGNYTVRTSPAGCFNYSYADRVILKGGTINSNKKLSDSLAAGYHIVDNGNGTFSIVAD